ncbi:MAG: hypothetical protein V4591_00130 [Bdellovibrionota bacterium]
MKFRIYFIFIFLFSFIFSMTSYAAPYNWSVDSTEATQVIYNFSSYALGGSIDSAAHVLKITGHGPPAITVTFHLPASCKIGNTTMNQSNTYLLVNGTQYSTNSTIPTNLLTASQGATTAVRFANTSPHVGGAVSCVGGNLTLSY